MSDRSDVPVAVTVIAPGTRVLGGLVSDGDLVVAGAVEGPIVGAASVRLEPGASVRGEVRGRDVVIAGALAAPVTAASSVRLLPTAEVHGDIEAPRVVIDDGALLEGAVRMVKARTRVDLPALTGVPVAVAAPPSPPQPVMAQPAAQRALAAPQITAPKPAKAAPPPAPKPAAPPAPPAQPAPGAKAAAPSPPPALVPPTVSTTPKPAPPPAAPPPAPSPAPPPAPIARGPREIPDLPALGRRALVRRTP